MTKTQDRKRTAKVETVEVVSEQPVENSQRPILIKDPTMEQDKKAREIYLNTYNQLRLDKSNGFMPKAKIKDLMRELGVWDDEQEKRVQETSKKINELLQPLNEGGISLQDMKNRAYEAQILRNRLGMLFSVVTEYESNFSYESKADDAKFEYLLYNCAYYEDTGEKVFKNVEEYNSCSDHDLINSVTSALSRHLYGDFKELYKELPESKFLIDYGFLDEDLKPTEKISSPVESSFKPFLDDDGNPIIK